MIAHRYFVIEKPDGFTARQWQDAIPTLLADLQRQRTTRYVLPHEVLHCAVRADGNAILVDGLVETDRLQPAVVADTLAASAGLDTAGRNALRTEMVQKRTVLADAGVALDYRVNNREAWDVDT